MPWKPAVRRKSYRRWSGCGIPASCRRSASKACWNWSRRWAAPADLKQVLDLAADAQTAAERRAALLRALAGAARLRKVQPEGDLTLVGSLLDAEQAETRIAAIDLAGLWRIAPLGAKLEKIAASDEATPGTRRAALDSLAALGEASKPALLALSAGDQAPTLRAMATAALAALDVQAASERLVKLLQDEPTIDPSAVVLAIVDRQGGAAALAEAVEGKKLPADAAKLAVRAVRSSAREEPALVALLSTAGGIDTPTRELTAEALSDLMQEVLAKGDPARGEMVFRRSEQSCLKCHAIAGAGGRVGPDLVSIGASARSTT